MLVAYGLSYSAQLDAYLFLLTDATQTATRRQRSSDLPVREPGPDRLEVGDELSARD